MFIVQLPKRNRRRPLQTPMVHQPPQQLRKRKALQQQSLLGDRRTRRSPLRLTQWTPKSRPLHRPVYRRPRRSGDASARRAMRRSRVPPARRASAALVSVPPTIAKYFATRSHQRPTDTLSNEIIGLVRRPSQKCIVQGPAIGSRRNWILRTMRRRRPESVC